MFPQQKNEYLQQYLLNTNVIMQLSQELYVIATIEKLSLILKKK